MDGETARIPDRDSRPAALVTVESGSPTVTEPHLISAWRWTRPEALPTPLFDPSAQILVTWRPMSVSSTRPPTGHTARG